MTEQTSAIEQALHPHGPQRWRDWRDYLQRVAEPLLQALEDDDEDAVAALLAEARHASPHQQALMLHFAARGCDHEWEIAYQELLAVGPRPRVWLSRGGLRSWRVGRGDDEYGRRTLVLGPLVIATHRCRCTDCRARVAHLEAVVATDPATRVREPEAGTSALRELARQLQAESEDILETEAEMDEPSAAMVGLAQAKRESAERIRRALSADAPSRARETSAQTQAAIDAALEQVAFRIEAELVCCDAFERGDHAKGHQICYWGAAARALVLDARGVAPTTTSERQTP